jgi:hypothetical protein
MKFEFTKHLLYNNHIIDVKWIQILKVQSGTQYAYCKKTAFSLDYPTLKETSKTYINIMICDATVVIACVCTCVCPMIHMYMSAHSMQH